MNCSGRVLYFGRNKNKTTRLYILALKGTKFSVQKRTGGILMVATLANINVYSLIYCGLAA